MHNFFAPPPKSFGGGGQNLNRKLKTFGFLNTLKVHIHFTVQLPYKDDFISPSNKTSRKNSKLMFLMLFTSFRFDKCDSSR